MFKKMTFFWLAGSLMMGSMALAKTQSISTDLNKDCMEVYVEEDPIDAALFECKAMGGYRLTVEGGDLRYSPVLMWNNKPLDIPTPPDFHDVDPKNSKVEWVYKTVKDEYGMPALKWVGAIYSLLRDVDGVETTTVYAVRLDGAKSCLAGTVPASEKSASVARKMILESKASCK